MFFKGILDKLGNAASDASGWIRDRLRELQNALWDRLGQVGQTFWNAARSVSNDLWQRLGDLGSTVWSGFVDVGNKLWGVIAAAAGVLRDAIGTAMSQLWQRLGDLGSTVWNGFVDLGNKLWSVIAAAAAAIRDAIIAVGAGLADRITAAAGRVGDSVDATAGKLDDVGATLKDLPGELSQMTKDALAAALGFPEEKIQDLANVSKKLYSGEYETFDELLSDLSGQQPHTSALEIIVYMWAYTVGIPSVLGKMADMATARMTQRFAEDHPSALLDPDDLRDAYLRGFIDIVKARNELAKQGFDAGQIEHIIQLWQELPPPSDLIRMAVREAFSPDIVARFGQHQDFPEDFANFAGQQGYSRDWALNYWAAHWELPSAEQGFEMFHRGVIGSDDLQLLLRALDVMPFWRGKLTDIAYNVVTRVDTRRLFAAGVWDRARVEREYLNQGYTPAAAADLTEWTVATYGEDAVGRKDLTRAAFEKAFKQGRISDLEAVQALVELGYDESEAEFFIANAVNDLADEEARAAAASVRDLTQGTILAAYKDGITSRGDAEALLADLGYTADGIDLILAVQDFKNANELATLKTKVIEQIFKHGQIGGDEARSQLAGAGIGVDRADLFVQRWEAQFAEKTRELTQAQLERAMEKGLIDEGAYVAALGALGYSTEDAQILLGLADRLTTDGARQVSVSTVTGAYKRDLVSRETTRARLVAAGFSAEDAELQLKVVDADLARVAAAKAQRESDAAAAAVRDLSQGAISTAYKRGVITRADALARLTGLGFRQGDAELLLTNVDAAAAPATG